MSEFERDYPKSRTALGGILLECNQYLGDSPESQKNYFFDLQFAPAFTSVCRANTYLNNNYDSLVCAVKAVGWNNQEQTYDLFQNYMVTSLEFGSKLKQFQEDTKQE